MDTVRSIVNSFRGEVSSGWRATEVERYRPRSRSLGLSDLQIIVIAHSEGGSSQDAENRTDGVDTRIYAASSSKEEEFRHNIAINIASEAGYQSALETLAQKRQAAEHEEAEAAHEDSTPAFDLGQDNEEKKLLKCSNEELQRILQDDTEQLNALQDALGESQMEFEKALIAEAQTMEEMEQADEWLSSTGKGKEVQQLEALLSENSRWSRKVALADEQQAQGMGPSPYRIEPGRGMFKVNFKTEAISARGTSTIDWQQHYYEERHHVDILEAEIVAFKNSWIPPADIKRDEKFKETLKATRKVCQNDWVDLSESEFVLDGGLDAEQHPVVILTAANFPTDLVEDMESGLACRSLRYLAMQLDNLGHQLYTIVYVDTEKDGEAPRSFGPDCIEIMLRDFAHALRFHLRRIFVLHTSSLWTTMTLSKMFSKEVIHVAAIEDLFIENGYGFDPSELVFPPFVYAHENTTYEEFTSKVTEALSLQTNRGLWQSDR